MVEKLRDLEGQVKRYYRHIESYDWTHAADHFIGLETIFHRARCREVVKLVKGLKDPGRCLDVGCGTGLITRFLPSKSVGVDLNPRNLEKAAYYAPHGQFVLCDAEGGIPVRDRSFDMALCTEMLEHLLYPCRALGEVYRILKPGGMLIGSVPGRSLIWRFRSISKSRNCFQEEPYHKHYKREEIGALLAEHFEVEMLYAKYFQTNWFFVVRKKEPF